jgi:hypothetical protein
MVSGLNTSRSPVRLVDIDRVCDPARDAYDGLHPNGVGEYKIAKAHADVLASLYKRQPGEPDRRGRRLPHVGDAER